MAVVMPVGPNLDPEFVDDTLASVEHYARPGYRLILIDDSGTDLCHSLRRSKDVTILIAGISGMRGALYLNVSAGFRAALEQPFDILLKLDTDALVIGSGFEAAAADFFRAHPRVATLGAHNRDYDGTPANKSWERNQILRHMTIRWRNTPKTSALIGWLIVRAWRHGYYLGESVDGGVCIYSRAVIEALGKNKLLGDPRLGKSKLEEDHLFGLALRACGMELADFGSFDDELPIGCHLRRLAASPEDLVKAKKALIHSTRLWEDMDEAAIRAYFGRLRNN